MTLLLILAVPIAMAIALAASVLGYWLAQQRYRALFEACQLDRAAAQSSIAELHGVASNLTDQVAQHTSRVVGIELALAAASASDQPGNEIVADAAAQLRQANEQLEADLWQVKRQLAEQTKRLKREQREARIDKTTSFLNRVAFQEMLTSYVTEAAPAATGGLALIEIDHFKDCNDRHGHVVGDRVLQYVATILRDNLVGLDASVARYGGGQFAVIFYKQSREILRRVLRDIRRAVEKKKCDDGTVQVSVTISTGLAMNRAGMNDKTLESAADKALTAARAAGYNRAYICEGDRCVPLEQVAPMDIQPGEPRRAFPPALAQEPQTPTPPIGDKRPKNEVPRAAASENRPASPVEVPRTLTPPLENQRPKQDVPKPASPENRRERRVHKRQDCHATYRVAPLIPDASPEMHAFVDVRLMDFSGGGCALLLASRPAARAFVVAIDKPEGPIYLTAEVVRITEQGQDGSGQRRFVIGCRFTGRISSQTAKLEAQTA
ncbi:MAG: diguanylate cyclase [Pirellulaceae bacterium]